MASEGWSEWKEIPGVADLQAENAKLKEDLEAANRRNPLVGIGYLYSAVGITQGDGEGTDEIYQSDVDRQEIERLTARLNAALEASSIAETGRLRAVEELEAAKAERDEYWRQSLIKGDEIGTLTAQLAQAQARAELARELATMVVIKITDGHESLANGGDFDTYGPDELEQVVRGWLRRYDALPPLPQAPETPRHE